MVDVAEKIDMDILVRIAAAEGKLHKLEQALDAADNEPEGYDLSEWQARDLFGGES